MKVIIAGGRRLRLTTRDVESAVLDSGFDVTEVGCGMAPGADTAGEIWAESQGIPVSKFPAQWARFKAAAGPIRNTEMSEWGEGLILIWDGKSKGSADMLRKAEAKGLKVFQRIVQ